MAHYDAKIDKILNCRPQSFAWEIENRRKEQCKIQAVSRTFVFLHNLALSLSVILLFGSTIIDSDMILICIGLVFAPYVLFNFVLEIDAWYWAIRRIYTRKKKFDS